MGSRDDELLVIMRQTAENLTRKAEDRRLFSAQYGNFDVGETIESDRVIEDEASTPDKQVWGDPELCPLFDGLTRGQVTPTLRKNSAYDMDYVPFKLMLHYLGKDLALAYIGCLGVAQVHDLKVCVGKPTTHYRRGPDFQRSKRNEGRCAGDATELGDCEERKKSERRKPWILLLSREIRVRVVQY